MITLYHNDMSVCAAKVRTTLAEKELNWDGIHLNLRAGDAQKPEYIKLNPNAVVPTFVHDDKTIIESKLMADLTGVEYGYVLREGRDAIILEKKEDMKKRGFASPDLADALALTFAYPVAASDHRWQLNGKPRHQYHYDPFQQAWSGRL